MQSKVFSANGLILFVQPTIYSMRSTNLLANFPIRCVVLVIHCYMFRLNDIDLQNDAN